jgi:multiple antibiotic resistance protein
MDEPLLQFTITAFVMLIVVINPVAVAPIFVGVTRGMGEAERRAVLNRAVVAAYLRRMRSRRSE